MTATADDYLRSPPSPFCRTVPAFFVRCGSMPDATRQCSLLDELDQRQDEVLAQLDELNTRIENLLQECLANRNEPLEPEEV